MWIMGFVKDECAKEDAAGYFCISHVFAPGLSSSETIKLGKEETNAALVYVLSLISSVATATYERMRNSHFHTKKYDLMER